MAMHDHCIRCKNFAWMESRVIDKSRCHDCAAACVECGNGIQHGHGMPLPSDYDGLLCARCAALSTHSCDECGKKFLAPYTGFIDTRDGVNVALCQSCYEHSYFTCSHCGHIFHDIDGICPDDSDDIFCADCAEQELYKCDGCGDYFLNSNNVFRDSYGHCVCHNCMDNGDYGICADCNEICHSDYMTYNEYTGYLYCNDCIEYYSDNMDNRVHDYGYKPETIFHKTDNDSKRPSYMGVELELSHRDEGYLTDTLDNLERYQGNDEENYYLKQDSSLQNGVEIVSHPRTLNSWHDMRESIVDMFERIAPYAIAGRDGLHVHISRRGMSPAHMVRFGAFIAAEQDNVEIVARRRSDGWAAFGVKPKNGADCKNCAHSVSRYQAVNWENRSTVELRVFASTLDPIEFFAAIEFAHAAYQFTKTQCNINQIVRGETWPMFLHFLSANKDKYNSLIKFLENHYKLNLETSADYIKALA